MSCVVYWLYDDTCSDPSVHGYVGVSQHIDYRLSRHRKTDRFPSEFKATLLFRGTTAECEALEFALRPEPLIGWNIAPGGPTSSRFGGRPKSIEARELMSAAKKKLYADPAELEKLGAAVKAGFRAKGYEHPRGPAHSRYGVIWSEETREKYMTAIASEDRSGRGNKFFGQKHKPETRALLSALASTRTGTRNAMFGKKHTPESIARMSRVKRDRAASRRVTPPS